MLPLPCGGATTALCLRAGVPSSMLRRGGGGACAHRRGNQYDMAAAEQQCMQARSTNAALPMCGGLGRRVYTATALRRCSNGICLCAGVPSSMQCRGSGGACAHRRGNQYAMAAAGQQRMRVRSTNEREAHTVPEGMGVGSNACGRVAQTPPYPCATG